MTDAGLTKQRAQPELITVGNRKISSTGRWNDNLIADYLLDNGGNKWIGIGELAKLAWGQNTKTTKERARRYLWRISTYLLIQKGQLVSYEYDGRHVEHVKIYDPTSQSERNELGRRLKQRLDSKQLSAERYEMAITLLGSPHPGKTDAEA